MPTIGRRCGHLFIRTLLSYNIVVSRACAATHKKLLDKNLCGHQIFVSSKFPRGWVLCSPAATHSIFLLQTHSINMHEIYESICKSKCESGFHWSTFPLTAVIFDWLWCIVNITFSLPDHKTVVHLKKKTSKCLRLTRGVPGREGQAG